MGLVYCFFLVFQSDVRTFMFAFQAFKFTCQCCNGSYYKIRFLQPKKGPEPEEMCMASNKASSNGLCPVDSHEHTQETQESLSDTCTPLQDEKTAEFEDFSTKPEEPERKAGAGFLIILFYYFQDALLLHVDTGWDNFQNFKCLPFWQRV